MKRGWVVLLLLVGFAATVVSHAQVAAYGEFSATKYFGGDVTRQSYLYGATTGIVLDGPKLFHKVQLSGDVQGRFVGHNGTRMDGVTIGPRFSFHTRRMGLTPFAEFMVGFARQSDGRGNSATDSTIQVNGGVAKQLSPRLDAVVDYSYSQFYYNGGEFNPKTFSLGLMYHFIKR